MKMKFVCIGVLLLGLSNVSLSQEPQWFTKMKQIKLLSDTYDDVVKLVGKPAEDGIEKDTSEYFDFDDGRMSIDFEPGNCGDGMVQGWKVAKWTVTGIMFSPEKWLEPKQLGIKDFKGYKANLIHDGREGIEYVNDELGIEYIVNQGKVQNVIFRPAKKYDHLRCE